MHEDGNVSVNGLWPSARGPLSSVPVSASMKPVLP